MGGIRTTVLMDPQFTQRLSSDSSAPSSSILASCIPCIETLPNEFPLLTVLALDLHFGEGGSRLLLRLLTNTTSIASFGGRWALAGSPRTPMIHDSTRCGRIVKICELTKLIARSKKHCKSCLRVVAGVILVHR